MKGIFTFFLLVTTCSLLMADKSGDWCGTTQATQQMVEKGLYDMDAFNEELNAKSISEQSTESSGEVYTIPCVVHIVWTNQFQNLDEETIMEGIQVLNEDFRRTNADAGNVMSEFLPVVADSEIEFCLANTDPDGNPHPGIIRVETDVNFFSTNNDVKFDNSGGSTAWPRDEYMNIWLCNLTSSLLGYAQFPNGNASTDGIVTDFAYWGKNIQGNTIPSGRTGTHEVGHWLGLRHVWGDGDCNADDFISDTPLADDSNFGCQIGTNSCTEPVDDLPDMVNNYMDYSSDPCQNSYTQGQATRMRSFLEPGGFRDGLAVSGKCADLIKNDAALIDLFFPVNEQLCNTDFEPVMAIANNGTDPLQSALIEVSVDGTVIGSHTWTGNLNFAEYDTIVLSTFTAPLGSSTVSFDIVEANGADDTNLNNNFADGSVEIALLSAENLPQQDDFEAIDVNNTIWDVVNNNNDPSFELTDNAAHWGDQSIFLSNKQVTVAGRVDDLVTRDLDFTSYTNPEMKFYYAHANRVNVGEDKFYVLLSDDCGVTYDTLFQRQNEAFQTGPDDNGTYIPASSHWDKVEIDLSDYADLTFGTIYFRFISGLGNNFYLDDINIFGEEPTFDVINSIETDELSKITVHPNPANDIIQISHENRIDLVQVYDLAGQLLMEENGNNSTTMSMDLGSFEAGIYYLNVSTDSGIETKKVVLY